MMIWSALHGNMQLPKRAASELASRREHMVKRAAFKWGIGRELYTAPFIWVPKDKCNVKQGRNGKPTCFDKFSVEKIEVVDGRIAKVSIWNDTTGKRCFVHIEGERK